MSFIVLTFLSCSGTRAEESHHIPTFNKADQEEPVACRMTHNDLALLLSGVVFVIKDYRKGISKNRRSFLKSDPVFVKVAGCLIRVPFYLQGHRTTL